MESGLGFPHKSYVIHCQAGATRKTSGTIRFSPVLSSINTSGEGFFSTFCPPTIRLRFKSSGSWKILNSPKNLQRTASASARSVGLSADEPEHEITSEDVTEFQLSGDETELSEVNYSFLSIRTAKKIVFKVRDVGKQFVMNNVAGVVGLVTMFQQQPEPEVLQVSDYYLIIFQETV